MSTAYNWLSDTPRLRISFFGHITIEAEGQPRGKAPSQKIAALSAYLFCNPGSHSREQLADLFWDDIPLDRYLPNLRTTFNRLPETFKPYIKTTRQTVGFEPDDDVWVDVLAFQQLANALPKQEASTSDEHIAQLSQFEEQLVTMLSYYKGPFLGGLRVEDAPRFSDWQFIQQQHLERLALQALHSLVELSMHQGRYADGIAYAKRLIELDPLDEEVRRHLMIMLAHNDDQPAALQEYQALVEMLDQELDVPPSPETATAYERIITMQQPGSSAHSNLPTFTEPPVGRRTELATLIRQTQMPNCQLLTITGLGGIGKTYLAVEAAKRMEKSRAFLHGVAYVPLAGLQSAERIPETIAQVLDLVFSQQDDLLRQICSYLAPKEMLIVLDNFEHLLESGGTIQNRGQLRESQTLPGNKILAKILQSAPHVKLLVTSRQPLQLQQEHLFPLEGMTLPPENSELSLSELKEVDAIRLFQQVALRNNRDFELTEENQQAVLQFCTLVQAVPLAIVLGAAHMDFLSPEELVEECQESLDVLETEWSDVPDRQRSVRAIFEYSWQQLDESLRQTFQKLVVFRGFTNKAARQVAGASITHLKRLHSQSLITQTAKGRFEIHELLRQFGEEKLAEDDEQSSAWQTQIGEQAQYTSVQNKHMQFYLQLIGQQIDALQGYQPQKAADEIMPDLNNIRQAWQWGIEQTDVVFLAKSREGLFLLYDNLGFHKEGSEIFTDAIEKLQSQLRLIDVSAESEIDVRGLELCSLLISNQAYFWFELGSYDRTLQQAEIAVAYANSLPDESVEKPFAQALGYWIWGWGLLVQSHFQAAYTKADQALSLIEDSANKTWIARCLDLQGLAYLFFGRYDAALDKYQQAQQIYVQTQNRRRELESLERLGEFKLELGEPLAAKAYFQRALQISHEINTTYNSYRLSYNLCRTALLMGEYVEAECRGLEALRFFQNVSAQGMIATSHYHLGLAYLKMGLYDAASQHLDQTLQLYRTMNMRDRQVNCLVNLSVTYRGLGDTEQALIYLKEAEQIADEMDSEFLQGYIFKSIAYIMNEQGQSTESIDLYKKALAFYANQPEHRRLEVAVGLAKALLESGDTAAAVPYIKNLLAYLEKNPEKAQMFGNPFEVYLNSYRVLDACGDERASSMLEAGHTLLQTHADRIDEPERRDSFLNVGVNREILRLQAEMKQ